MQGVKHGRSVVPRQQYHHQQQKRASSSCTSLYQHPSSGETVTAYQSYNITWDCSCLDSVTDIDITLYYYGGGGLHAWTNVPCSDNSLTTTFNPTWWNSSLEANVQLQIQESGQPSWATTTGLGPQFELQWNGTVPASATGASRNGTSSGLTVESIDDSTSGGLSGGKLAAAVTVPLLAAAVGVALYIFYSRRKSKGERKRWSAYVDHRMSQYSSAAWDPNASGEHRPSMMMIPGHSNHPSLSGRPNSTFTVGTAANFAGVGSNRPFNHHHGHSHSPSTATAGTGPRSARPASSFYALDGHSAIDHSPNLDGHIPLPSPPSQVAQVAQMRQIGHRGHPSDRASKVSFADNSFSSKDFGHSRSSYFGANNKNRNSFNPEGQGTLTGPLAAARNRSNQDLAGVATSAGHAPSSSNGSSIRGAYRPSSLAHSNPAFTADDEATADDSALLQPPSPEDKQKKPKKHNITISTSMPFITQPKGRESILSPDDLLKAYASAKSPSTASPAAGAPNSQQSSYFARTLANPNAEEELADDSNAAKKSKFGSKKFGLFAK